MNDRTEMRYPAPDRRPRLVRAGSYEVTLASKQGDGPSTETRKERRPIHIHTTKVLSHALAQELRSRAHTLVTSEAAES